MSEVTNDHILREIRLLRGEVKVIDEKFDLLATAVSNHGDRLFDIETRLDAIEQHVYGAANGAGK